MSQQLVLQNKGLVTNSNQLSEVPDGALTMARNIVIDKDSVAESRRGYAKELNPAASDLVRNDRATSYQDHLIVRRSNDDSMAYKVDGVGYTSFSGTYQHPDDDYARMQFAQSNGNLYFTTSAGIRVLDAYTGPIYSTGMPRGLDGTGAITGASGFMNFDRQVAYRIVFGSRDANNNLYLGTPSQRIIVVNPAATAATRDVALTFTLPAGITTSDFFQVYRSRESASESAEPSDELQLVYEANPSGAEIIAKSVTFTDSRPVSLMGASLYTSQSQEGISESNDEPPFAKDMCLFKGYMFYLNVKTKQRLSIKLISVGGSGLVNDDTIVIDGVTYTGKGSETIASGFFKVSTGGSAAQNIADTAQSLVKVINQYASNTSVYAYYVSGYQDLPGQIELVKRTLGDTTFAVTVSRAVAWDIGTGTSSGDQYQNGFMWSKNGQPEHVPSAHLDFIGSKNYEGRRILALRDSVFVLKDDGVFRITGSGGQWSVEPLDVSTRIIAPDSAVVVNNQIMALCDQGIVAISDVGVQVISRPIEDQIQAITSEDFTSLKTLSFGVGYDTDRKYILWTIATDSDNYPTQAFVYNTFTQAWTTWDKDAVYAFVNPTDDRMYLCDPEQKQVLVERKALDFRDYADEEIEGISIVSSNEKQVVLDSIVGVDVGFLLYESSSFYSVITAVDAPTKTVTVNEVKAWTPGTITILKCITNELEYTAQQFKNPGVMKHFQEVAMLFRESSFIDGLVSFFTDLSGGYEGASIVGNFGSGLWGLFPWGSGPWGGLNRPKPIRVFIPREKSRGSFLSVKLTIANAFTKWALNGISLQYEYVSERTGRS
jgi:hypothetical protein